MLAEYPVIVDYPLSPVTSPLFDRELLLFGCHDDTLLTGTQEDVGGLNSHLGEDSSFSDQIPVLLCDDDVSSISASIQYSDRIDDEVGDFFDDNIDITGDGMQDCSILDAGESTETPGKSIFGSVDSDYLSSSYLPSLHDSTLPETVSLDIIDPVDPDLGICVGDTVEVADFNSNSSKVNDGSSLPYTPHKRKQKKTEDKAWSEMNSEEQEEVADHLSSVLGSLLGPRERIEVMKMILSDKSLRLSDKDFVIEPHMLNERTLAKLETYLDRNQIGAEASDSELVISAPGRKRNRSNGARRKCSSLPASPVHPGSCSTNSSSLVSKKQSNRQKSSRAWRRKTRKEYRQASKERRSGLFHQEEVLSLSRNIEEDDEEIDILD